MSQDSGQRGLPHVVRTRSSVLFIHGLWLHPSCWGPWMQLFIESGYQPSAPGWPGVAPTVEDTRAAPESVADRGVEEVADHYARIIDRMPDRPVVVGHSFGALIGEMLLMQGLVTAAIAIGAVHIDGVPWLPFAPLRDQLPLFTDPANRNRAVSLTAEQFRESFGNAIDARESDALYARWSIPAPSRPLFEAAEEKLARYSPYARARSAANQSPLFIVVAGKDRIVPAELTGMSVAGSAHSSATDVVEFPDRGHSLTIDSGWHEVANTCIDWLWNEHHL